MLKWFAIVEACFTHRNMPARYSPDTPRESPGMPPVHFSPLVQNRIVGVFGSLWHSSESSWTRSPMKTSWLRSSSAPVLLGAPQPGLQTQTTRFQVRNTNRTICCHLQSLDILKNEEVYTTFPAGILFCFLSDALYLMHPIVRCCRGFISLLESMQPQRRVTGGDRLSILEQGVSKIHQREANCSCV